MRKQLVTVEERKHFPTEFPVIQESDESPVSCSLYRLCGLIPRHLHVPVGPSVPDDQTLMIENIIDHNESIILGYKRIDIRFVNDNYGGGICGYDVLDHTNAFIHAGGSVGVRENDAAVLADVVLGAHTEFGGKGYRFIRYIVHIRPYIIERVGYIREQYRLFRVEEGHERHRKHVVGAYPDKYL